MSTSDAGIHSACMGGIWQCVVQGFAGVEAAVNGGFDCAGIGDAAQDKRVTIALKSFDNLQKLA